MPSCLLRFRSIRKAAAVVNFYGARSSIGCARFTKMAGEPPPKKVTAAKTIGTHNGTFHCDEALACFLLKQLPAYEDANIVRSRDSAVLSTCDIVVDVGGVYDPATNRFDHHQRTFSETMHSLNESKKWTTKLSSAGLIYAHFGREVIAKVLGWKKDDPNVEKIYDKVYENFMEEIDAIDNGVKMFDEEPRYRISTNLSARVAHLNPPWNEPNPNPDEKFQKALKLTGEEFLDRVRSYATVWMPARDLVFNAIQQRQKYIYRKNYYRKTPILRLFYNKRPPLNLVTFGRDLVATQTRAFDSGMHFLVGAKMVSGLVVSRPSHFSVGYAKVDGLGSVVTLSGGCCPWKDHLLELEEELGIPGEVKFVLYEDMNKAWMVQGVPPSLGSFDCRVFLPKKWCGLRDKELSDASGIEGCVFVHSNGFIGGNKTREGALQMAVHTLKGID